MKKFAYLLALALPMIAFTSCHDDDKDLPNVDYNITISGAEFSDGQIYVAQGDTLKIDAVTVVNNEQGKAASIPYANYYWDGYFIGQSVVAPYAFEIEITDKVPVGLHALEITSPVYAVDKAVAFGVIRYKVNVVEAEEDMPEGGTVSHRVTPGLQETEPAQ